MGQVYRARDTKLDRDVALKLLPPEMSEDGERLARFEREARTLAQLQHPNVASIYGFEQVGEHRFLVMELAEGQDLAARLASGPLPLVETLEIGRQICLGLEAAHEKGIIHRDLKPANVMIGPDGQAKILDFGLARAFDDPSPDHEIEHSPTLTAAMTRAGVILGTAAYMSPEQARGRSVDQRSDVWAFGVVVFEMLTGSKAFGGETVSDMVARILEREPPWDELPQPLHPSLERLLRRCLVKESKQRLHSASDARLEIEEAQGDPTGAAFARPSQEPTVISSPLWKKALPWAVCVGLAAWALYSLVSRPHATAPLVQFEITAPAGHQFSEFRVSPDGSAVVFAATARQGSRTLWLRRIDSTELSELPKTENATFPFWSPDSNAIAFFSGGKLRRLDLASNTVQTIADAPNGRGGDWHEDGTILFTPDGEDVLYAVAATGGTPKAVTTLSSDVVSHRFPHFLANGRRFVFSAHSANSTTTHRLIGSLDSDELVELPDGMSEAYAPPGFLLYIVEGTLVAQHLDDSSGRLTGERSPLASGIDDTYPRTASSAFSVSDNGVLAFLQTAEVNSHFRLVNRRGELLETVAPAAEYSLPAVSRDGSKITFVRDSGVWLLDLVRGTSTRLFELKTESDNSSPAWFRGDACVMWCSAEGIVFKDLAGGPVQKILDVADFEDTESLLALMDVEESPDGSFLAFTAWDPITDYDLWILRLGDTSQPQRLSATPRVQQAPQISPNGRWIAYESDESGRFEIYVRPTESGDAKWLISTGGGSGPIWSEDGTELFYLSSTDELMSVRIGASRASPEAGLPVALFMAPLAPPLNASMNVVIEPRLAGLVDGNFLFQVPVEELPPRNITVVLNWQHLLNR